jgi:hypothetical protein
MLREMRTLLEWMKRFANRKMVKDSQVLRQLATTCFVLAGFSFTALTLFISYYRWDLNAAADRISELLICSIFFIVAGELARDATKVWEYMLAEIAYLLSTVILLAAFLTFVLALPQIHPMAIGIMVLGILFFLAKAIYDIWATYTTNPKSTALVSCLRFE